MDSPVALLAVAVVVLLLSGADLGGAIKSIVSAGMLLLLAAVYDPSLSTQFGNVATGLQTVAATVVDAANGVDAVQELLDERQLVVIQHDHWLMDVLCQAKRIIQNAWITKEEEEEEDETTTDTDATKTIEWLQQRKTTYLCELLRELKPHSTPRGKMKNDEAKELSERVVRLASVFSELLPAYEPLLVEVALVHCLHEWSSSSDKTTDGAEEGERDAAVDFEAYFLRQMQSEDATNWFNCQFFIDSMDLLCMTPLFYKQRIHNQALRDVISISVVEARGDTESFCSQMISQLVEKKNETLLRAWRAWLGEEIATVGALRRDRAASSTTAATSLFFLRNQLMNTMQLDPRLRGYFPLGSDISGGFRSTVFRDLSGVISAKKTDTNASYPGFIFQGGKLSVELETKNQEQDQE